MDTRADRRGGAHAAAASPRSSVRSLLGFGVLFALTVWSGQHIRLAAMPLAVAWAAPGVATAWLLVTPGRRTRLLVVALVVATCGAVLALGDASIPAVWLFGPTTAVAATAAASFLRASGWRELRAVRTFDDVRNLALAALVAGVLTTVALVLASTIRLDATLVDTAALMGLRNAVSTFVMTAAIAAVLDWRRWSASARGSSGASALIVLCVVVAAAVMLVPWPIAFVMVAPVIVMALRCGPEPTIIAVGLQALVVVIGTARGFGQFTLIGSPEVRVLIAQMLAFMLAGGTLIIAITAQDRSDALAASRRDRDRLQDYMEAALVAAAHLVVEPDGEVRATEVNGALATLTRCRRGLLIDTDPRDWLVPADGARLAAGIRSLSGGSSSAWRSSLRVAEQHGGGWVDAALALVDRESVATGRRTLLKLQMVDITAQRKAEEELARAALHDDLTGLANRVLWAERLRQALVADQSAGESVAVLFVDVDHFKQINDAYGHDVGDEVLREVAQRLRSVVRPDDTVARMGGDEFVIACPEVRSSSTGSSASSGFPLAERIHQVLSAPVVVGGRQIAVTVSIGVGVSEPDDRDGRVLLRRADTALYAAKAAGRARTEVYRRESHQWEEQATALLLDLEQGQRAGEMTVHYQPIVDAVTGVPVALEALLRWRHPLRGFLEPKDFLDVLEGSDLIHPVGGVVLERACADGARLHALGHPLDVHVNVSAPELERPGLADRVRAALDLSGLPPALLVLEVTETRLVAVTPTLLRELEDVRGLGVRLAVDDFGTGYSTLTHLVQLPVGVIKLDRSFVAGVTLDAGARSIATGVRAMAEGLGVEAVAEGVETAAQAAVLRELGYRRLQGFHCGRPGPLEDVLGVLVAVG